MCSKVVVTSSCRWFRIASALGVHRVPLRHIHNQPSTLTHLAGRAGHVGDFILLKPVLAHAAARVPL